VRKHHPPSTLWIKRIAIVLTVGIAALFVLFIGYYLGLGEKEEELDRERQQTKRLIEQIKAIASLDETVEAESVRKKSEEDEIRRLKEELKSLLDKEHEREALMPQHEYAPKDSKALPPPAYPRAKTFKGGEARLVIIIDDVSYKHDVDAIRSTGLPLVMSFLPPTQRHPDSAKLAQNQPASMVHLPLEAISYDHEEPTTLRISSSEEEIEKRIGMLKKLYPNVRYMNNHTGSKFTADEASMERLINVMKKEGLIFVDSRTTAETKVPEASAKFGLRYIGRDVFLDHESGVGNVKKQIKEAVDKAKRYGSAIAIGHPRPDTIKALQESKEILGEVHLVGIDQL